VLDLDETDMASRRRCRPNEVCSTLTDVAALSDCGQSDERCACPRGYVLQHGACEGQFRPLIGTASELFVRFVCLSVCLCNRTITFERNDLSSIIIIIIRKFL